MAGSVTIQIADTLDDGIFKGGGPEPDTFITGGSGVQFGKFSLGSFWEFAHGTLRFPLGTTIPALSEITAIKPAPESVTWLLVVWEKSQSTPADV